MTTTIHDKTLALLQKSLKEQLETIFRDDIAVAINAFFDGLLTAVAQEKNCKEADKQTIAILREKMQEIVKYKASFHLENMLKGLDNPLIELSILLHNIKNRR